MSQHFFIKPEQIDSSRQLINLESEDSHHLMRVLRHHAGDHIFLSDGLGNQYQGKILDGNPHKVVIQITESKKISLTANAPTVALGLLKSDHWELALQKLVEVGCSKIIPFVSSRTIPRIKPNEIDKKMIRWNKIAQGAAKQSGLPKLPELEKPILWRELLADFKNFSSVIIPWEWEEKSNSIKFVFEKLDLKKGLLVIGPEGGFSQEEVKDALAHGASKASLGDQILRSETAAIVGFTLWQYNLGNI